MFITSASPANARIISWTLLNQCTSFWMLTHDSIPAIAQDSPRMDLLYCTLQLRLLMNVVVFARILLDVHFRATKVRISHQGPTPHSVDNAREFEKSIPVMRVPIVDQQASIDLTCQSAENCHVLVIGGFEDEQKLSVT
jgi:hypothetical protein